MGIVLQVRGERHPDVSGMSKGYDGEYYTEADEQIEDDY